MGYGAVYYAIGILRGHDLLTNLKHAPARSLRSSLNGMRQALSDNADILDATGGCGVDAFEDLGVAVIASEPDDGVALDEFRSRREELIV